MDGAIKLQRSLDRATERINKKRQFKEMVESVQAMEQTTLLPDYF